MEQILAHLVTEKLGIQFDMKFQNLAKQKIVAIFSHGDNIKTECKIEFLTKYQLLSSLPRDITKPRFQLILPVPN